MRSSVVEGAISGTYDKLSMSGAVQTEELFTTYPVLVHPLRNLTASSGGKSTIMNPFTPASLQSASISDSP